MAIISNDELNKIRDLNDFSWIKVKKYNELIGDAETIHNNTDGLGKDYIVDEYINLREHHIKETQFLIAKCQELATALALCIWINEAK